MGHTRWAACSAQSSTTAKPNALPGMVPKREILAVEANNRMAEVKHKRQTGKTRTKLKKGVRTTGLGLA